RKEGPRRALSVGRPAGDRREVLRQHEGRAQARGRRCPGPRERDAATRADADPLQDAVAETSKQREKAAGPPAAFHFPRLPSVTAVLSLRNLVKVYPSGTRAIDDVSLDIHRGEFVVLIAP